MLWIQTEEEEDDDHDDDDDDDDILYFLKAFNDQLKYVWAKKTNMMQCSWC